MIAVTGNGDQLNFAALIDGVTENVERTLPTRFTLQLKKGREVIAEMQKTVLPDV